MHLNRGFVIIRVDRLNLIDGKRRENGRIRLIGDLFLILEPRVAEKHISQGNPGAVLSARHRHGSR